MASMLALRLMALGLAATGQIEKASKLEYMQAIPPDQ
jgi:hypothetical protein